MEIGMVLLKVPNLVHLLEHHLEFDLELMLVQQMVPKMGNHLVLSKVQLTEIVREFAKVHDLGPYLVQLMEHLMEHLMAHLMGQHWVFDWEL